MGEAPPVGNFALKWEKFVHAMIDNGGYRTVLDRMQDGEEQP